MSEPTSHELAEKIADIREWLVRIDAKMDVVNETRATAEEARKIANEAKALAQENARDIEQLANTIKWAIGIISTVILGIAGLVVTIVF
ncbi:holin [Priestia megaterium]|uniref:holin n=1 Tax=Priestia megaterium TaxID=1404 RepID=UPI000BFD247B|nr:holin [Priestia megaterium]PGN53937.1 holin [Priestia megaterium]